MTVESLLTQWRQECLHAQEKYDMDTVVDIAANSLAMSMTWMYTAEQVRKLHGGGNVVLLLYPKKKGKPESLYGVTLESLPYSILKALTVGNGYRKLALQYIKSSNGVQLEETIGEIEIV